MRDGDDCGAISGMIGWQRKPKYWEETFLSVVMFTVDPI
jgi:hypothetical protein